MDKLDYFQKTKGEKLYQDLEWNLPEQKTGHLSLIGGNSQNFANVVKTAESLSQTFPIKTLSVVLPDALSKKLPPLPGLVFTPSSESGSFKKSEELNTAVSSADFSLILGDLSKNSATAIAIAEAVRAANSPVLLTRDSIDLIAPELNSLLEEKFLIFLGSMPQIQKVFRAVYYPKMLMLSMPLLPAVEALHKFTLTYSSTIITLHQEQILIASGGKVIAVPLEKTPYSPLSLWGGELAARIAGYNLYNPGNPLEATAAAVTA